MVMNNDNSYTADTCTICDAPIGYYGGPRVVATCRSCEAWECEYECAYCDIGLGHAPRIYAHLAPCEHGVQDHHCIVPDPNKPWPPLYPER